MDKFIVEFKSFFMDDEPEYDVCDSDVCSVDFIANVVSTCDTFVVSLDRPKTPI